jgi:anaerobic C4-dicarboxylate transporter DcuA
MMVTIPATLLGTLAGVAVVYRRGTELADDPVYVQRLAEGKVSPPAAAAVLDAQRRRSAIGSCLIFLVAIVIVVLLGLYPPLRPVYERVVDGVVKTGQIDMGRAIMIVMLAAAGAIMLLFRVSPEEAVKGGVMKGGLVAFLSILGVSWLGSCFFDSNEATIVGAISAMVAERPWLFAVGLFALSILLMSQAATIVMLAPLAASMGLSPQVLIGVYPAVNGTFFLPTYGTILAAVSMDQTGTTRIGKYLLNHSFMLPGLVSTAVSTAAALAFGSLLIP